MKWCWFDNTSAVEDATARRRNSFHMATAGVRDSIWALILYTHTHTEEEQITRSRTQDLVCFKYNDSIKANVQLSFLLFIMPKNRFIVNTNS